MEIGTRFLPHPVPSPLRGEGWGQGAKQGYAH